MSTLKDCTNEVNRELTMRITVYPKLIASKKLHEVHAKKQFNNLKVVAALLDKMTEKEFLEILSRSTGEVKKNLQLELL